MAPENVVGVREQLITNDLTLMHKTHSGESTINFNEFFTISDHQKDSNEEIGAKKYTKAFAKSTFAHRIHKYWNYLPLRTRNLPPVPFKRALRDLMKNKRDRQYLLNIGLKTPIDLDSAEFWPDVNDRV